MPGMLSENAQSSDSGATPPAAAPGAGNPPRGEVPGSGQPQPGAQQDVGALRDQAIQLVYGERFDQLIKMFQSNGPEKFARSMGIAVNTAISELEKTNGPLGPEVAAEIGGDIFAKLLEDMLVKPKDGMAAVVEGVTGAELQQVMPAILVMYADSHPDVSKQDVQAVMQEIDKGVKAGGAPQSGAVPEPAAPGPESIGQASPPPTGSIPPGGP
ncbi:MAG: hypothetical protein OES09_10635 [Gammaproteobacteria bacterium]|nr:hypothetical protein [Gammaproteobacteria bacterium]